MTTTRPIAMTLEQLEAAAKYAREHGVTHGAALWTKLAGDDDDGAVFVHPEGTEGRWITPAGDTDAEPVASPSAPACKYRTGDRVRIADGGHGPFEVCEIDMKDGRAVLTFPEGGWAFADDCEPATAEVTLGEVIAAAQDLDAHPDRLITVLLEGRADDDDDFGGICHPSTIHPARFVKIESAVCREVREVPLDTIDAAWVTDGNGTVFIEYDVRRDPEGMTPELRRREALELLRRSRHFERDPGAVGYTEGVIQRLESGEKVPPAYLERLRANAERTRGLTNTM